jgi:hypothetical protein
VQLKTHQRLGEVLIEQGLLSERQLDKALKKQDRTRVIAAFMAMILGPMSFGAFASHSSSSQSEQASANVQSNADRYQGLKPLNDSDLENIQGQGFDHTQAVLASLIQQVAGENAEDINGLGALDDVLTLINPLASMFDAEVTVKGVKYNNQNTQQVMHEDGSIELKLPSEIEEIAFKDLRVKGSGADRVFGDIVISDIKFSEHSSIRITVRP